MTFQSRLESTLTKYKLQAIIFHEEADTIFLMSVCQDYYSELLVFSAKSFKFPSLSMKMKSKVPFTEYKLERLAFRFLNNLIFQNHFSANVLLHH